MVCQNSLDPLALASRLFSRNWCLAKALWQTWTQHLVALMMTTFLQPPLKAFYFLSHAHLKGIEPKS